MAHHRFRTLIAFLGILGTLVATSNLALAQSAALVPNASQQFFNAAGQPLAGGSVYFYVPNTTTPKTVWSDPLETTPYSQPVQLDSGGFPSNGGGLNLGIFGQGNYRQQVYDALHNLIWDGFTSAYGSSVPAGATGTDTAPVGSVMSYSGFSIPINWALAYGQALSRSTYAQLLAAITIATSTGGCTSTSTTVSGFTSTAQIPVGSPIESTCLPSGTTVASIVNGTTITVSQAATATGTFTVTDFPWGNGDAATTFNVPDLRGRVLPGADCMGGLTQTANCASRLTSTYYGSNAYTPGVNGGGQSVTASTTLATANLPSSMSLTIDSSGSQIVSIGAGQGIHTHSSSPGSGYIVAGSGVFSLGAGTNGAGIATTAPAALPAMTGSVNGAVTVTGGSGTAASSAAFSVVQPSSTINYIIKIAPNTTGGGGVTSFGGMFGDIICASSLICAPIAGVNTVGCAIATTSQQGCIHPDGTTTVVDGTGKLSAVGTTANITVGVSTITGGAAGRILYDNGPGTLGEYTVTGSAGSVVLSDSPTIASPTISNLTVTSSLTAAIPFNLGFGSFNSNIAIGSGTFGTGVSGAGNTAIGANTLHNLSSGIDNVAIGLNTGAGVTTGSANVYIGTSVGQTASSANYNVGIGYYALYFNTGGANIAIGYQASGNSTTGADNLAIGYQALYTNVSGTQNVAIGDFVLSAAGATAITQNTCVGYAACQQNTGSYNNVLGQNSLAAAGNASENSVLGQSALTLLTSGGGNDAIGNNTLVACLNCTGNNGNGAAMAGLVYGNYNTADGNGSFPALGTAVTAGNFVVSNVYVIATVGSTNFTSIGAASNTVGLQFTASGAGTGTGTAYPVSQYNTAIGATTGTGLKDGNNNTIVGAQVTVPAALSGAIVIATGDGTIRYDYNKTQSAVHTFSAPIAFTGATPTVGAGQIGLGNTTVSAGSGTCPSGTIGGQTIQGCWTMNIAGTARLVPFF